ncbi:MAG: outer membrane beta-barrel protein, partial [Bacteroidetes bacterium]|nr:outer membrane beta-barrel protein [Bacteroidota bacterium]
RVEYMISDKTGIGADVNYEVSGYSFKFDDYTYDANGNYLTDINGDPLITQYTTKYAAKKLRAMFRLNYHFVQSEKVDMYSGFGAGYKSVNRSVETNPKNDYFEDANASGALIPVTLRVAIGAKIYFTQNIGAHVELGAFGGGLLQAGLSVKF